MTTNKQIVLDKRPAGEASTDDFKTVVTETAPLRDGELLIRHQFLSLDPYMRGRMNDAKSYATPQPLGQVMLGGTVGEVIESKHPGFAPGDHVLSMGGWQEYSVADANASGAVRKIDTSKIPASAYLGVMGMPGVTAWFGLMKICDPKPGETVVVSAASGAVGGVVVQLAKLHGCHVVGVAGGPEKVRYVTEELGADACLDHKQHSDWKSLRAALATAAPKGVDCDFENVGGPVLEAVMASMNAHGRMALCGLIAGYDGKPPPMLNPMAILTNRLKIQGFIISEHKEAYAEGLRALYPLVVAGKLKFRETVAHGLESAPQALLDMLKGKNFGKQLVKLY